MTVASIFLLAGIAPASPLTPGGSYQFENHSAENHRDQILDGIDLSFGTFAGTNLRNSSLINGIFEGTDFSGANLRNTNFTGANLTNAIFSPTVNLRDANLSNAILVGINLTGVNITNTRFTGASYDATTILTFDPINAGMLLVPETSPMTLVLLGLMGLVGWSKRAPLEPRIA